MSGTRSRLSRGGWLSIAALAALCISPQEAAAQRGNNDVQRRSKNLTTSFAQWSARHQQAGGDQNVVIALGWSKGLSESFTKAKGTARLNLVDGIVRVKVSGLDGSGYDVWLVDNQPSAGGALPTEGDLMKKVGTLSISDGVGELQRRLGPVALADFDVDVVVVTEEGKSPDEGGVLFGMPTLFQRMHRAAGDGKFRSGGDSIDKEMQRLVRRGEKLFFKETFRGNGRTCGTCHRAENNFTIDPAFIATLPDDDPLFVAEFIPALSENFEKPELMRSHGLILANTNGFGDPETNFTMRSVPHTLAMRTSLEPSTIDGTTQPPFQRTGWSGDGAPGGGTLREFAIGAVTQHYPLTLGREPGVDFRLPTDEELDAMEAFQLSLGRQEEIDLSIMEFKNADVTAGLEVFNNAGKCAACHFNAGANVAPFISPTPQNANFNTGVEAFGHPASLPPDDGFGSGSGTFNTTTLVEAADSGPFFHNNSVDTIEEAVDFYNSEAFNESPGGVIAGGVSITDAEVAQVAALLRVLNALENIRSATQALGGTKHQVHVTERRKLFDFALAELDDAIGVLNERSLHPRAVDDLRAARRQVANAARSRSSVRDRLVQLGVTKMKTARQKMVSIVPQTE